MTLPSAILYLSMSKNPFQRDIWCIGYYGIIIVDSSHLSMRLYLRVRSLNGNKWRILYGNDSLNVCEGGHDDCNIHP